MAINKLDLDELAKIAYQAYGDNVNWIAFNGQQMPPYILLPGKIKTAWKEGVNSALVAYDKMLKGEFDDDDAADDGGNGD